MWTWQAATPQVSSTSRTTISFPCGSRPLAAAATLHPAPCPRATLEPWRSWSCVEFMVFNKFIVLFMIFMVFNKIFGAEPQSYGRFFFLLLGVGWQLGGYSICGQSHMMKSKESWLVCSSENRQHNNNECFGEWWSESVNVVVLLLSEPMKWEFLSLSAVNVGKAREPLVLSVVLPHGGDSFRAPRLPTPWSIAFETHLSKIARQSWCQPLRFGLQSTGGDLLNAALCCSCLCKN